MLRGIQYLLVKWTLLICKILIDIFLATFFMNILMTNIIKKTLSYIIIL